MSREVIHMFHTGEYDPLRIRARMVEAMKREAEENKNREKELNRKIIK